MAGDIDKRDVLRAWPEHGGGGFSRVGVQGVAGGIIWSGVGFAMYRWVTGGITLLTRRGAAGGEKCANLTRFCNRHSGKIRAGRRLAMRAMGGEGDGLVEIERDAFGSCWTLEDDSRFWRRLGGVRGLLQLQRDGRKVAIACRRLGEHRSDRTFLVYRLHLMTVCV